MCGQRQRRHRATLCFGRAIGHLLPGWAPVPGTQGRYLKKEYAAEGAGSQDIDDTSTSLTSSLRYPFGAIAETAETALGPSSGHEYRPLATVTSVNGRNGVSVIARGAAMGELTPFRIVLWAAGVARWALEFLLGSALAVCVSSVTVAADDEADTFTAARALLAEGKTVEAITKYDLGRQVDPTEQSFAWSPAERLDLVLGFFDQGREEEALLQTMAARQEAPTLNRVNYVFGLIYHGRGDVVRAGEALNACAFPAAPASAPTEDLRRCQLALGTLYATTGNLTRAQELVTGLLKAEPDSAERATLHLLGGLIRHARGDIPGALAEFEAELTNPNTPPFIPAYYAILSEKINPAISERLATILAEPDKATEASFLTWWGHVWMAHSV
jgi:tetratricopeptide (TPR) repeat protein